MIVENVPIARDTYRLRLGDAAIAGTIRPGQFVMIRPGPEGSSDPLLGRPFALYDIVRDSSGSAVAFDIVYLVIGRGTTALSQRRAGEMLSVWGPLGNGFGPAPDGPVIFVAGGIGQTPFLALGRWWLGQETIERRPLDRKTGQDNHACSEDANGQDSPSRVTLLYGVRTAALLAGLDDFRAAGIAVEVATDDGTAGHHGFVTDLLARRLEVACVRPGSSDVDRPRCYPPSHDWPIAMGSPARSPWRTTWPAGSASASVAWLRSARMMARPTCAGSASKGPWSPPIAWIGR